MDESSSQRPSSGFLLSPKRDPCDISDLSENKDGTVDQVEFRSELPNSPPICIYSVVLFSNALNLFCSLYFPSCGC